jgi:hypothetical protein
MSAKTCLRAPALLALVLVVLAGCGSPARSLCEEKMACEGGNELDIDACVVSFEAGQATADVYDCSDSYEKYFDCVESTAVCNGEKNRLEASCDEAEDAFKKCVEAASARD